MNGFEAAPEHNARAHIDPRMASSPTIPRSSLALRRIALLEGLSDERLDLLAQQCLWHSVDAGKPLLMRAEQQGDV